MEYVAFAIRMYLRFNNVRLKQVVKHFEIAKCNRNNPLRDLCLFKHFIIINTGLFR